MLSIPKMQNLARKGWEFEPECMLIIISRDLKNLEKKAIYLMLHTLL